ncbi:hypothetical protein D3C71_328560 [compost metagenome]
MKSISEILESLGDVFSAHARATDMSDRDAPSDPTFHNDFGRAADYQHAAESTATFYSADWSTHDSYASTGSDWNY